MKPRKWKTVRPGVVAVVAVTALLAAGCSDDGGDADNSADEENPSDESDESGDDEPSEPPPPLTLGAPSGPITNNNNPFVRTSAASILGYAKVIYEPLAQTNATDPAAEPTPWLASDWTWSDDFTNITITMRDGVQWADGEPATADDIAFTFNLFTEYPTLNLEVLPIASATSDGSSATVTFAAPQFVNQHKVLETLIVPEHLWSQLDDPSVDTIEDPVGTGPYVMASWSQQAVIVEPNPGYWGGDPIVPELRYVPYNDSTALTSALTTGEVNWTGIFLPDPEGQFLSQDPDNRMWFPTGLAAHTLFFNTADGPFTNVALRQAVNLVIDRERINAEAYAGLYAPVTNPVGIAEPAGSAFIAPEYEGVTYEFDVDAARALLTDAGYTFDDNGKLHDPSGEQVTVELIDPATFFTMITALEIIGEGLAEIGVDSEVTPLDGNTWTNLVVQGDFDATINFTNLGSTPYNHYKTFMDGDALVPLGEPAAANFGRFDNAEAAEALRTYASASDDAERTEAMATLQDVVVNEVPGIPLLASPMGSEFSVTHYVGWPDEDNPYANPQPHGINAAMILMNLELAGS
jgi:peptide/nickel transport system substrate-binding protein